MAERFANAFATTLSSPLTADGTTAVITVESAAPTALHKGEFAVRIDSELFIVTSGQDTTTWTATRAAESTTAAAHAAGAEVSHDLTARSLLVASRLPAATTRSQAWIRTPGLSNATATRPSGFLIVTPIAVAKPTVLDLLAFNVTTAGSAEATIRPGIWDSDADGLPGRLLYDAGAITAATTGFRTHGTSGTPLVALQPGIAWLGIRYNYGTTSPALTALAQSQSVPGVPAGMGASPSLVAIGLVVSSGGSGALPDPLPAYGISDSGPLLWARAA